MSVNTSDFSLKKTDIKLIIKSFYELMKPRVMSLVIFTALVGLVISPNKIGLTDSCFSLFFMNPLMGLQGF